MRFERGTIFYYRNKVGYSTYNNKKIAPCFRPYINQTSQRMDLDLPQDLIRRSYTVFHKITGSLPGGFQGCRVGQ